MIATLAVLVFAVWLRWLPALSFASDVTGLLDVLLRLRHAGHHARRRHLGADDPHDPRGGHRDAEDALYRDGAAQGRLAPAHRIAPRPAERDRADRQRRRASLSYLVGGVIIVETIFNYPGIAKLMVDAVSTRDLPLIQTCAMASA